MSEAFKNDKNQKHEKHENDKKVNENENEYDKNKLDDYVIDLVYTWVDGSDKEWLGEKHKYMKLDKPKSIRSFEGIRYKDLYELKHSLRSVQRFVPFFRKIFIVTNGQIPKWLKLDHPKIQIVRHVDIFNSEDAEKFLPTFNSIAIEANLHHIPDLSEYFVYLNDDVFFGRKMSKKNFIKPDGRTKVYMRDKLIPVLSGFKLNKYDFKEGLNYTQLYLNEVVGYKPSRLAHQHVGYCLRKSILFEIEHLMRKTGHWTDTLTRFRQNKNIKLISFFYPHYCLEKGMAVNDPKLISIKVSLKHYAEYSTILKTRPHMFCLNGLTENDYYLKWFYSKYFPKPSTFEK